jgi:hypothetical protein
MCVLLALGVYFPLFSHELISLISAVAPPGERHLLVTQMKTRMAMVNSSAPFIWCQVSDTGTGTHCAAIAAGTKFGVAKVSTVHPSRPIPFNFNNIH